jgi:hypothetical protein
MPPGFRTRAFAPIPYLTRLGCAGEGLPGDGSARGARVLPAAPTGGGPAASRGGGPTAPTGGGPAASRGGGPAAPAGGANVPPSCASPRRGSGGATVDGNRTGACPLCCTCTSWTRGVSATRMAESVARPPVPVHARSRGAIAMTEAHRTMGWWICGISLASFGWRALGTAVGWPDPAGCSLGPMV